MLKFSKMHGLGNDFVVIDAINQQVDLSVEQIQFLADRQFGIGCDQFLLVEMPTIADVDFRYRIFNADGSEVQQCGNGVRCFAKFVRDHRMTDKDVIAVETSSGIVYPSMQQDGEIKVDMGKPNFEPNEVPFIIDKQSKTYLLSLSDKESVKVSVLSMGNPHTVILVDDVSTTNVEILGPQIEGHVQFPERVNAGFMHVVTPEHIDLRVYERGVGETLACGTGACAAVVSGIQQGLLARQVKVRLPGGELKIAWPDDQASVFMTGPASHVFDGEIAWATIQSH